MAKRDIGFKPLSQTTLSERIYHILRDRLLGDQSRPGEYLREIKLSEVLGVSRTPVREALSRLASEGLLERMPQRGIRVPHEPFRDQFDLFPIVSELEMLAGSLALPKITESDIARLNRINARMRAARRRRDADALVKLNNQFHHVFCERSGNRRLSELLDSLRVQTLRVDLWYFSSLDRIDRSIREHDEIIRGIKGRNFRNVLAVIRTNFALTQQCLAEENGLPTAALDTGRTANLKKANHRRARR